MKMNKNQIIFWVIAICVILFFVRNNSQTMALQAVNNPGLALQAVADISCSNSSDCPQCIGSGIFDTGNTTQKLSSCVNGKCQFSDWCIQYGDVVKSVKEWTLAHPFAWIKANFLQFVLIVGAIIAFLLIFLTPGRY